MSLTDQIKSWTVLALLVVTLLIGLGTEIYFVAYWWESL